MTVVCCWCQSAFREVLPSKDPATGSYPEPDESSHTFMPVSLRSIAMLFPVGLPSDLFYADYVPKILYAFLKYY
jgi:hypothetical protein